MSFTFDARYSITLSDHVAGVLPELRQGLLLNLALLQHRPHHVREVGDTLHVLHVLINVDRHCSPSYARWGNDQALPCKARSVTSVALF